VARPSGDWMEGTLFTEQDKAPKATLHACAITSYYTHVVHYTCV